MAGLSAEFTSLVEAADDPAAVLYAVTHLGAGVTALKIGNGTDKGFGTRVRRPRHRLRPAARRQPGRHRAICRTLAAMAGPAASRPPGRRGSSRACEQTRPRDLGAGRRGQPR